MALTSHPFKRAYRVREICQEIGVSKSYVFQLIQQGHLIGYKLNGVLLIDAESYQAWLASAEPKVSSEAQE